MGKSLLLLIIALQSIFVSGNENDKQHYAYFSKGLPAGFTDQTVYNGCSVNGLIPAFPLSEVERLKNTWILMSNCDSEVLAADFSRIAGYSVEVEMVPEVAPLYEPDDLYKIKSLPNCGKEIVNYHHQLIGSEKAWDLTKGSKDIKIAIIDQGFDPTHEDFKHANGNSQVLYWDGLAMPNTHGTFVAGCASAATGNGKGIAGTGFNTKLLLYSRMGDYSALYEAVMAGARIINLSWGGLGSSVTQQLVINEITGKGVTIVAAAGNGIFGISTFHFYPASYDNVISVTSIGPSDNHLHKYYHQNDNCKVKEMVHQFNDKVDISAPGYEIIGMLPGNNYGISSGTSFASPIVAGVIALMLDVNPALSPKEIEDILKCSADKIDHLNIPYTGLIGEGRLNAFKAVQLAAGYINRKPLSGKINSSFSCDEPVMFLKGEAEGGVKPYEFLWTTENKSGPELKADKKKTYELWVKDAGCAVIIKRYNVDQLFNPSELKTISDFEFCPGSVPEFDTLVSVTGGSGEFEWSWYMNGGLISTVFDPGALPGHTFEMQAFIKDVKTGCTNSGMFRGTELPQSVCENEDLVINPSEPRTEEEKPREYSGDMKVFPNPFSDQFTILLPREDSYSLSLVDISGREVYLSRFSAGMVGVGNLELPAGVYVLIITGSDGVAFREKLIHK